MQRENARLQQELEFLKRAAAYFREGVAMSDKYAAITRERHRFPVTLCEALRVSPSGFYAAQQTKGRYGSPRLCGVLTDAGSRRARS